MKKEGQKRNSGTNCSSGRFRVYRVFVFAFQGCAFQTQCLQTDGHGIMQGFENNSAAQLAASS